MNFTVIFRPGHLFFRGVLEDGIYRFVTSPHHPRSLFFHAVAQLGPMPTETSESIAIRDGDRIPLDSIGETIKIIKEKAMPFIWSCRREVPRKRKSYDEIEIFGETVWIEKKMMRPETQSKLRGIKEQVEKLQDAIDNRSDMYFFTYPQSTRQQRTLMKNMPISAEFHKKTDLIKNKALSEVDLETALTQLQKLGIIEETDDEIYSYTFRGLGYL